MFLRVLNCVALQWLSLRVVRVVETNGARRGTMTLGYRLLGGIVPLTGWIGPIRGRAFVLYESPGWRRARRVGLMGRGLR